MNHRWILCLVSTIVLVLPSGILPWGDSPAVAARPDTPAETQDDEQTDEPKDDSGDASKAEKADFYAVPDTVPELQKFIDKLRNFQANNAQEFFTHREKAGPALKAAAEKIVKLEEDKSSSAHQLASQILLELRIQGIGELGTEAQRATLQDVVELLKVKDKLARQDFLLAFNLARNLEYSAETPRELAAEAYTTFARIFGESREPSIARNAAMMQGAARRLTLVGEPFELEGTQLDGTSFDLESLRDKVVLVDFWATWCGPCIAEYPNIKKNYEKYHDQGFEVVGVSIDQDRAALEKYIADKEVPWITLHEKDQNGQHSATLHYGIFGIPTMILVGRDGKVLSTKARGPELTQLLEKAFSE